MRSEEFVQRVEHRAAGGLRQRDAARAVRATLTTLAERLPREAARGLAAQLPVQIGPALQPRNAGQQFSIEEFLDRVAAREEVSRSEAFDRTRAVMSVLADAVTGRELDRVRADLPPEFGTLFEAPAVTRWPDSHTPARHC